MKIFKILGLCTLLSVTLLGKEIDVTAYNWGYEPKEIVLKKGEPVKLTLISKEGDHGLGSKDLCFDLEASPGKAQSVEITPNEVGEYTAKCTMPCGSGHKKMFLKIKVE